MCRVNDDDWEPEGREKRSAGKCEGIDFSSMSYEMKMGQSGAWEEKCILILYTVERAKRIKANVKGRFV